MKSLDHGHSPYRRDELSILRQSVLPLIAVPAAIVGWFWVIYALNEMQSEINLLAAAGPSALFAASASAAGLNDRSNTKAAAVLLVGISATSLASSWLSFAGLAPYTFSLVVSVAGLLLRPSLGLAIALPASAMIVLAGRQGRGGPVSFTEIMQPLAFLWLTASVTYLSARNLYRAVEWAWESADLARERAEEAMSRRGELRRALHSFDGMYSLLAFAKEQESAAREEAEQRRRQMARFAANVSHELRTPLNLIIGFSELMCMAPEVYGDFAWPSALRTDASEVYRSSLHLQHLIDDILDLSQLDAMRMQLTEEETSIETLIRESAAMASGLVRGKDVDMRVEVAPDLPPLWVDRTRIRQVLLNLLTNAARFTERGSITVSADLEDAEVHIAVSDTGIGMTPEQLTRVFREFEQGDESLRRRYGGTGLGLALSKRFVELHGGCIWAESDWGKGSVFHVSLPTPGESRSLSPDLIRTHRVPVIERGVPRRRVVVLQGEESSGRRLLSRYVQGYRFIPSRRTGETLELVAREHPWAVLLAATSRQEIKELASGLAAQSSSCCVPLLAYHVLSASAMPLLRSAEWLPKPVRRLDLLDTLSQIAPSTGELLIVDDDPAAVQLLASMARSGEREYIVREAFGGAEALEAIAANPPDALLLDLIMPDVSGLDVLKKVRETPATRDLPVLIITAGDVSDDQEPSEVPEVTGLELIKGDGLATQEWLSSVNAVLDHVKPRYVPRQEGNGGDPDVGTGGE